MLLNAKSALPYLCFLSSAHLCIWGFFLPINMPQRAEVLPAARLPKPHGSKAGGCSCSWDCRWREGSRAREEREGLHSLKSLEKLMRCPNFPGYFLEKQKPTPSKWCIIQMPAAHPLCGWEERVKVVYTNQTSASMNPFKPLQKTGMFYTRDS